MALKIIFWLLVFIVFYAYIGYGILLFFIIKVRRLFKLSKPFEGTADYEPEVTLFVTAFNEKDYIDMKVQNSLENGLGNRRVG